MSKQMEITKYAVMYSYKSITGETVTLVSPILFNSKEEIERIMVTEEIIEIKEITFKTNG